MTTRPRQMLLLAVLATVGSAPVAAGEVQPLSDGQFAQLHKMLKPRPGESRWMEIDWYPSIWQARQRAAAEGKPLFLMAGSGGAPAAGC